MSSVTYFLENLLESFQIYRSITRHRDAVCFSAIISCIFQRLKLGTKVGTVLIICEAYSFCPTHKHTVTRHTYLYELCTTTNTHTCLDYVWLPTCTGTISKTLPVSALPWGGPTLSRPSHGVVPHCLGPPTGWSHTALLHT